VAPGIGIKERPGFESRRIVGPNCICGTLKSGSSIFVSLSAPRLSAPRLSAPRAIVPGAPPVITTVVGYH